MIDTGKEARRKVERAVIVGVQDSAEDSGTIHEHLNGLQDLAHTLGVEVIERFAVKMHGMPTAQYYIRQRQSRGDRARISGVGRLTRLFLTWI